MTSRLSLAAAAIIAAHAFVACGDPDEAPSVDAARLVDAAWDAGPGDAEATDATADALAMIDAAVSDAAELDAAVLDAVPDAAMIDAAANDAASTDAATIDAATIDAATIDAQLVDARPVDARPIDAPITDAMPIDAPGDLDGDGVTDDLDCAAGDPSRFTFLVTYTDLDGDGVGAGPRAIQCLGATLPPGRRLGGYDDDDLDAGVIESEESEDELLELLLD